MVAGLTFDPSSPEVRRDLYGHYRRLREEGGVQWSERLGMWVLSRYADVSRLLNDHRLSVNRLAADPRLSDEVRRTPRSMLNSDPPEHTRLRRLVNRAFTPRTVDSLRPRVEALVDDLLDGVADHGGMDAMSAFAYTIPVTIMASLLGVPERDRPQFRSWTTAIAPSLDPIMTPKQAAASLAASESLRMYFRKAVAAGRAEPGEDLIGGLLSAQEADDWLTDEDIVTMCILLLVAGHETTVNLIGNGILALLQYRSQLERWRENPGISERAVEELLRFNSPVQMTGRVVLEDMEVGGQLMARGQDVLLLLGSANRDADQFADPDALDLARAPNAHLSFGHGIHYCLGAPLARLEGRIALEKLITRFPYVRLDQETIAWRNTIALRGVESLVIRV